MRVTEKAVEDLEFLAVYAPSSSVIHAMQVADHPGWSPGLPGKTYCGRIIDEMLVAVDIMEGDRPCKSCERTLPVVAIMFETSEVVGDLMKEIDEHNRQVAYMGWLNYGIYHGFVSPPVCIRHQGIPLLPEEMAMEHDGEDFCVTMIRADCPSHPHDHGGG